MEGWTGKMAWVGLALVDLKGGNNIQEGKGRKALMMICDIQEVN